VTLSNFVRLAEDIVGLVVGILGFAVLFVDPREIEKRARFLKISLCTVLLVSAIMLGLAYWTDYKAERNYRAVVANKERVIREVLCQEGELNYEELYNETSQGYDSVPNDAIGDMSQNAGILRIRYVEATAATKPNARSVQIRLYHVEPFVCSNPY
jgi:hypothetical protein